MKVYVHYIKHKQNDEQHWDECHASLQYVIYSTPNVGSEEVEQFYIMQVQSNMSTMRVLEVWSGSNEDESIQYMGSLTQDWLTQSNLLWCYSLVHLC